MVDGLGAVAVGIEQERAVVVAAVLRPGPGLPVVGVAGLGARLPEGVDLLAGGRPEAHVEAPRRRLGVVGAGEREVLPFREGPGPVALVDAQGRQDRLVEPLRGLPVVDADRHVVEHREDTLGERVLGSTTAPSRGSRRARPRAGVP